MSKQTADDSLTDANPEAATDSATAVAQREELARIHAMHHVLFELNPDGVVYADRNGIATLNAAALEMLNDTEATNKEGIESWQSKYGAFKIDGITPCPPAEMPLFMALGGVRVRDGELILKNTKNPEGVWISCNADPLPGGQAIAVFRDISERKRLEQDLAQRNAELSAQLSENNSLVERLRLAVDELSTPVLELADDILALPVVGIVDTVRSARMMEKILAEVVSRRCRSVIIDITGVDVIDTSTADRFIRIARAIELLGADCVISGVQPAVAQTLTDLGVSFRGLTMQRNLKRALDVCVQRQQQSRRNHTM